MQNLIEKGWIYPVFFEKTQSLPIIVEKISPDHQLDRSVRGLCFLLMTRADPFFIKDTETAVVFFKYCLFSFFTWITDKIGIRAGDFPEMLG
jgi:hypothetical protein